DPQLHGEPEAAALARADRDRSGDRGLARILLLLFADEIDRPAEAGRIAGGEQMLGRRGARLAGAAHLLGDGQVGADDAVARLRVAVASALCGRGRGIEWLDLVHGCAPLLGKAPGNVGSD